MTIKDFLAELACVDRTWSLINGEITSNEDELCPIHEVWLATREGEENGQLQDYFEEGLRLGLRKDTVSRIAAAADNRDLPPSAANHRLRARLLKACAIEQ